MLRRLHEPLREQVKGAHGDAGSIPILPHTVLSWRHAFTALSAPAAQLYTHAGGRLLHRGVVACVTENVLVKLGRKILKPWKGYVVV